MTEGRRWRRLRPEEQPYVDALVASFTSGEDEDFQLTEEQAECVAPSWIDTIGMERIEEAGVEPEDIGGDGGSELADLGLSEAEGNELYDAFGACDVDIKQAFIDGIAAVRRPRPTRTARASTRSSTTTRCARSWSSRSPRARKRWQNDEELTSVLLGAFAECPDACRTDRQSVGDAHDARADVAAGEQVDERLRAPARGR